MTQLSTGIEVDLKQSARYAALCSWLEQCLGEVGDISPLAGDASFRRYYRVTTCERSFVLMDAPAHIQSSAPFVAIAKALKDCGLTTPDIFYADLQRGFLLLSDFGDRLFFNMLNSDSADRLYTQALDSLVVLQACDTVGQHQLPCFTQARYQEELNWFVSWYVEQYQQQLLSAAQRAVFAETSQFVIEQALAQPQVFVHKDFHSRNLMLLPSGEVGIIDFQDALTGPITYDLMSLLYDHYIEWPYEKIQQWARQYQRLLLKAGVLEVDDFSQFMRWHDCLALQRILKNCGNFVRLNIQHNKPRYLDDIPRIYRYILHITARYPQLKACHELLLAYQPEGLR